MTMRTLDAVLRKRLDGNWETEALGLPGARVMAVLDGKRTLVFEVRNDMILTNAANVAFPVARIELHDDLVSSAALEQSKLDLEREKIASGERLSRRTLVVSVLTAAVTAGATIAVAAFTTGGTKLQAAVFRDLNQCRNGLVDLKTLATLDRQTLPNVRAAALRHADACIERLDPAIAASAP